MPASMLRLSRTRHVSETKAPYCVNLKKPSGSSPPSEYVRKFPRSASAIALPVVLGFPEGLNVTAPVWGRRPFWSLRFRVTMNPAFTACRFFSQDSVSVRVMSVVGDSSEADGPVNFEFGKLLMVTSGIPSSYRPRENTCGKAKPYVSRFQASPAGGIRWLFHEVLNLTSLTRLLRSTQAWPSW